MRKLEGFALRQISIIIVVTGYETLALRLHQVDAHQLSVLPVKKKCVAVAAANFCQQAICAQKISPVTITVMDS